ncbi:LysR family transcriptional regulator [Flavobacterium nackdongense]|uniref:LysR family transcriptional regulator n=1 Tax=Flavobacterium nackdongense TaxID=2547394 RepID=A0A4P6Y776_9FLAO|nr:LysR family transcriptional regulator [Flavobacterium nackdongense]QBN18366.1 LysR family transcriptional regulator [Flavobacterium nackdongense]
MNYTLHQLLIFLKVTETKSITKAAEELHLTQPAVSIQLKNLQNQFDIPLTEVVGRQLFVTDFGLEIAETAQKIINEVQAINYKTMSFKGILSGKLRFSVVSTGKYVMPYFLTDFLKMNSGIDLSMDVTNKAKVIASIENNEVDFALVSVLPKNVNLNSEVLLENKLHLIGNKEAIQSTTPFEKSIFAEIPLIYREEGSATRLIMEQFFDRNEIKAPMKMELTSNEAVKQAVIAGLGYSIMPLIGSNNELINDELRIIPVSGFPITSEWRIVWLENKVLSPVAQAYLNYLKNEKEQIAKKYFSWTEEF